MIEFERNYQKKVLFQRWKEPYYIDSVDKVQLWKDAWTHELKAWHSPYKTLIDASQLTIVDEPQIVGAIQRMIRFFEGFFLRKAVGYRANEALQKIKLPFEWIKDETQALTSVGLGPKDALSKDPNDLRSSILIENHFKTHCVEVSFLAPVNFDSSEKLQTLRSKLTNNLMQWHSKWNLLMDCTDVQFDSSLAPEIEKMTQFFRGVFMKKWVGYGAKPDTMPFEVYRARHKAVTFLENEGAKSGDDAECRTGISKTP